VIMRRVLLVLFLAAACSAQVTPNLGLNIPTPGTQTNTWGFLMDGNFSLLDNLLSGVSPLPSVNVSGAANLNILTSGSLNGVLNASACADSFPPAWCSGSDMGSWIPAAYNALPADGGTIQISGQASAYSFSSPISFTTNNKIVSLQGTGTGAATLNYTGSGTAISVNWGGQHIPDDFLSRVNLTGPSSSGSTVGINIGSSGTFTDQLTLDNLKISGFGTGITTTNGGGGGAFDITLRNVSLIANGTGFAPAAGSIALYMYNSAIAQNLTCGISLATGPEAFSVFAGDIEQNGNSSTTGSICIAGNGVSFHTYGVHFENTTPSTSGPFIYASGTGNNININGGDMLLDAEASTTVPEVINFAGADTLNVESTGLSFSTGITLTQAILSTSGNCSIYTKFRLGQTPGSVVGGSGGGPCANIIEEDSQAAGAGNVQALNLRNWVPLVYGIPATLTGTGACATRSGASTDSPITGPVTCTGTTGASTLTITPGLTAPHGWTCSGSDVTTAANVLRQSGIGTTTTCPIGGTVNANDVLTFTVTPY